jgi:hypothetical protein
MPNAHRLPELRNWIFRRYFDKGQPTRPYIKRHPEGSHIWGFGQGVLVLPHCVFDGKAYQDAEINFAGIAVRTTVANMPHLGFAQGKPFMVEGVDRSVKPLILLGIAGSTLTKLIFGTNEVKALYGEFQNLLVAEANAMREAAALEVAARAAGPVAGALPFAGAIGAPGVVLPEGATAHPHFANPGMDEEPLTEVTVAAGLPEIDLTRVG